jgi:hypothetical protein
MITLERLEDLIASNPWMLSWIECVRSLQEIKMFEMFREGNFDDGRTK